MNIAIIGASGSIGTAVTKRLLETSSHTLTLFSHHAERIHYKPEDEARLHQIDGDILKQHDITNALRNVDVAVYLVHLMGSGTNFSEREKRAATNFVNAAKQHNVKRVIYVGGMGTAGRKLTKHLSSREQTGRKLKAELPVVIEFKVPMVIGKNAAGFEVIRSLVNHTRVLPVPTWANATTQPITLSDVAKYVCASVDHEVNETISVEIGGPETLSYTEVMKRYAAFNNKSVFIFFVPFVPKRFVAFLFRLRPSSKFLVTVADMIESAGYHAAFESSVAKQHFPTIDTTKVEADFF